MSAEPRLDDASDSGQAIRHRRRAWVFAACVVLVGVITAVGWWMLQNRVWLQNPGLKGIIVDYAQRELGVEGVEVGDWKQGGECIAAEVTTEDDETYRVILVAQNPGPQPYDLLGISQIYTLDDFIGSSDAWCGIIHTPAYVNDKDGERIIG